MVTRDDVARKAGTSSAVVSYVVNGGPRPVSAATRTRVLAAIDELGYRPNALAQALRGNRSRAIGLIVPDNSNAFFAQLARAVEDAAFERGCVLLLGNSTQDDARQAAYIETFLQRQLEGIILIADSDAGRGRLSGRTQMALSGSRTPLVLLDRKPSKVKGLSLRVDNEGGAYVATAHLLEHGHERVACVAGTRNWTVAAMRTEGWLRALRGAGIYPRQGDLVEGRFTRADGYRGLQTLFPRGFDGRHGHEDGPPTAVFVQSDEQAVGVIRAAADIGVRVPSDLAVVSFDGTLDGAYTIPSLTTIEQPVSELGRRAVALLLDREPLPGASQEEVLPVRLIARQSCGCLPMTTTPLKAAVGWPSVPEADGTGWPRDGGTRDNE